MDILFDTFLIVYALTIIFVGSTFTTHLDVKTVTRAELVGMIVLGLLPVVNTIIVIIAMMQTFKQISKEVEEQNKRNRDRM